MAFTHLHTVVEGSQSLGLVVLREGSAQTVVPFVPLRAGAVSTGWVNHSAVDLPGTLLVAEGHPGGSWVEILGAH